MVTEPDGFVVHPDTLLRRGKALVKTARVTPITLHLARHSYAELALGAGVRLDVVSRQLGHASISTTASNSCTTTTKPQPTQRPRSRRHWKGDGDGADT
jgi:integrase